MSGSASIADITPRGSKTPLRAISGIMHHNNYVHGLR
jgi:hypothetical protein